MNTDKDTPFLFANESVIFRIISIAKIVSWVILVIYLISFVNDVAPLFQGQMQWPVQPAQWLMAIASLFFAPAIGLFYFVVLQGVAQGLSLGLDIYYDFQAEEEEVVEE
jgi:hypothetical protein